MLTREKIAQAIELLNEQQLDLWITFCRETMQTNDPALNLIYSGDVVWLSAFMIGKNGENIALVGKHDADGIIKEEFATVIGYDEDFTTPFLQILQKLNPQKIGLNFSLDNPAADGLSHGLWLKLQQILKNTPFIDRLTSANSLINQLRGIKTSAEVKKIQAAIDCAEAIIAEAGSKIVAGLSELDISLLFKQGIVDRQVSEAWSPDGCPAVSCGPDSPIGHNQPSADIVLQPNQLVHIDFGVIKDNYASDLQRVWYLLSPGATIPDELTRAFSTVRRAIIQAAKFIKPGVLGYQVDQIARQIIIDAGYPEYKYALGHTLGQKAHDGGAVLGPLWPRYQGINQIPLRAGNVFTLELGVPTSKGYLGLEEVIVIEETGCQFLSHPQKELWVINQ